MQSKEKDWEVHVKEVDKLQSKKLTMYSNAEIESLFKLKVTND